MPFSVWPFYLYCYIQCSALVGNIIAETIGYAIPHAEICNSEIELVRFILLHLCILNSKQRITNGETMTNLPVCDARVFSNQPQECFKPQSVTQISQKCSSSKVVRFCLFYHSLPSFLPSYMSHSETTTILNLNSLHASLHQIITQCLCPPLR